VTALLEISKGFKLVIQIWLNAIFKMMMSIKVVINIDFEEKSALETLFLPIIFTICIADIIIIDTIKKNSGREYRMAEIFDGGKY